MKFTPLTLLVDPIAAVVAEVDATVPSSTLSTSVSPPARPLLPGAGTVTVTVPAANVPGLKAYLPLASVIAVAVLAPPVTGSIPVALTVTKASGVSESAATPNAALKGPNSSHNWPLTAPNPTTVLAV